jgi:hypothetical protein
MGMGLCGLPHVYDEETEIEIWSKIRSPIAEPSE